MRPYDGRSVMLRDPASTCARRVASRTEYRQRHHAKGRSLGICSRDKSLLVPTEPFPSKHFFVAEPTCIVSLLQTPTTTVDHCKPDCITSITNLRPAWSLRGLRMRFSEHHPPRICTSAARSLECRVCSRRRSALTPVPTAAAKHRSTECQVQRRTETAEPPRDGEL